MTFNRLAGTVAANQADAFSGVELEIDMIEKGVMAVGQTGIF
jgi:hypothetical protein